MCSKHCICSENSLRLAGNGEVASAPEQFFEEKNLPQKNCSSPSISKMKSLRVLQLVILF